MGNSNESNQVSNPYQKAEFRGLLDKSTEAFGSGGFYDDQYAGGMDTVADLTPEQLAMKERLLGTSNQGLDLLQQTLGPYDPNNPALTSAIDMANADIARGLKENELIGIDQGATGAGQFGSSRHGVAEGIATRGAAEAMGDTATQMRLADLQGFKTDQQAAMQNFGNLAQGFEAPAAGIQDQNQAEIDAMLQAWEYESGVPLQDLMTYKQLISGDMGGRVSGTTGK